MNEENEKEIIRLLKEIIEQLKAVNDNLNLIFTK